MPHDLRARRFTPDIQATVQNFSCGDEDWSIKMSEWISGTPCIMSMNRGTEVWLFSNDAGTIVGFGSVGVTDWPWPEPGCPKEKICIIPAMAVHKAFQGNGYSRRIIRFLVGRAITYRLFGLALYVNPQNEAAIELYRSENFAMLPDTYKGNCKMVLILEGIEPANPV